jgi:transcriptional regulator with XRE-family HTH domain
MADSKKTSTGKAKSKSSTPAKSRASKATKSAAGKASRVEKQVHEEEKSSSLIDQFTQMTGLMTGTAVELAKTVTTLAALEGGSWIKETYLKAVDPDRLQAMADAGHFLKDAREVAGLTLKELSEALGLQDSTLLEEVEQGNKTLSLEMMFRVASLIARHDPIPFMIKFFRTYNPKLGATMDQWGLSAIPKQYERERRFINLYRKHDELRKLSDEEFDRLLGYTGNLVGLTLEIMAREKAVNKS